MSLPKKYRPAWKGMGWWRWLSIILIAYSLILIVPYVLFGGGSHAIVGTTVEVELAGCRVRLGADIKDNSVRVTAKIDPACSLTIEPPTVELLDSAGSIVTSSTLRGNPNMLSTRLRFDEGQPVPVSLTLKTSNLDGGIFRQLWHLTDLKQ